MKNIKKEYNAFIEFKKQYNFTQLLLEEKNGQIFYKNISVKDENGNILNECEYFINVGYKLKGSISKALSNLFPYEFVFRGKKVNCIESVFQGIKFPNIKEQNLIFKYYGLDSSNIKIATNYDWKISGKIYWQGKTIDRFSQEYENFIDELYISAIQNPLYRNILEKNNKYILHSIGELDKAKTVFTRYEFEKELNCLSEFLKLNKHHNSFN